MKFTKEILQRPYSASSEEFEGGDYPEEEKTYDTDDKSVGFKDEAAGGGVFKIRVVFGKTRGSTLDIQVTLQMTVLKFKNKVK